MLDFIKSLFGGGKKYESLTADEFQKQMRADKKKVLLDVRSKPEFDNLKIPNALNIDIRNPNFKQRLSQMDKSKSYYVYCQSGGRSARACRVLTDLGFEKVYNLKGGIIAYEGKKV